MISMLALQNFVRRLSLEMGTDQYGLLVAFDGASCGNSGPASIGVCLWWGSWSAEGFSELGAIACVGRRLGRSTNNVAEATAMRQSMKQLLRTVLHVASSATEALYSETAVGPMR